MVSYLLYMSLSTVWLVSFSIAHWPALDTYRTAFLILKWAFYLLRLSCLFFVSSSSNIRFRHGIYLSIVILFGSGPLFKALADPVSHHVLQVIGRRFFVICANAFMQWVLFDAVSIPIMMLSLPGLILYVGRCLVYLVSEDTAVEDSQLSTFMLHSNIVTVLSAFSAFCALIVHFIFFRMQHRSRVHPGKLVTIGKQFVRDDTTPVVPSAIYAPSPDGPDQDQEHVTVHLPQPAAMLSNDEQQQMHETFLGEPLPPPDAVADPSALLAPATVPASPAPIQYDSEGTVSANLNTAARVLTGFNRSSLLGALHASEAVQDVSSEVGSPVTSFDSIHSRPIAVGNRALPHPHETMDFQGAWEEFGGAPMDDWLRTFVITGEPSSSGSIITDLQDGTQQLAAQAVQSTAGFLRKDWYRWKREQDKENLMALYVLVRQGVRPGAGQLPSHAIERIACFLRTSPPVAPRTYCMLELPELPDDQSSQSSTGLAVNYYYSTGSVTSRWNQLSSFLKQIYRGF